MVADESLKEITIAYSLPEESQLWAVGYILGRLPRLQGPPNRRSVTPCASVQRKAWPAVRVWSAMRSCVLERILQEEVPSERRWWQC